MTRISPRSAEALDDLLAVSNQIGQDDYLVLRGGGNCSVKTTWISPLGEEVAALFVKGSGHDMGTLTTEGLTPLDLASVRGMLRSPLTDQDSLPMLLSQVRLDASFPAPSVESLTHAAIASQFVVHSHADIVQALTDTANPEEQVANVWGQDVIFVEYASPGVPLGRAMAASLQGRSESDIRAIIVGAHGIFAFGETAQEALDDHNWVIDKAHEALGNFRKPVANMSAPPLTTEQAIALSALRREVCEEAQESVIVTRSRDSVLSTLDADSPLVHALQRGPVTPDHVTWVGPWVVTTQSPAEYSKSYRDYVAHQGSRIGEDVEPALGYPRALLNSDLGLLTIGREFEEATATQEILDHSLGVVQAAEALGGYKPASQDHVFDLEYWAPQRQKYTRRTNEESFAGRIILVTGAASGIGRGCAKAFLDRGATVIGWDLNPSVTEVFDSPRWFGQVVNVSDFSRQEEALNEAVERFGGLDSLVLSAGIFPAAQHIAELDLEMWDRTLRINATASTATLKLTHPFLANSYGGGYVCGIVSKNVPAPGYGAVAYSASKAAMNQALRIAALEWAGDGIRVNMVHPDAVFDTALWTPELLAKRAAHYEMSVDDYKKRNLLHAEVTSAKVGDLAATVCSPVFSCTTGAQIAIDGGSDRII